MRLRSAALLTTLLATAGLLVAAGPASAHHVGNFDENACRTTDVPYHFRNTFQYAVDINRYDPVYANIQHYDNDLDGMACNDGANNLPFDPNPNYNRPASGSLDQVSTPGPARVTVAGWAYDYDESSWQLPVHVYVDGVGHVIPDAAVMRPDLPKGMGGDGRHGFQQTFPVDPGTHRVCAYAINYGPYSPNTLLGCRSVTVAGPPQVSPVGAFDALWSLPDGSVLVMGWAADPETIASPLDVHVWVDGVRGYPLRTGTSARPDVLGATGAPVAGFQGTLPAQGPGRHTACAYALNAGPTGYTTTLGCRPLP